MTMGDDEVKPNLLEAQFLASQKARLSNLTKSNANDEGNENLQAQRKSFWSAFKQACSTILIHLDGLYSKVHVTAQQRNESLAELQQITTMIRAIHHYTNHSKSTVLKTIMNSKTPNLTQKSDDEKEDNDDSIIPKYFHDFTMPDLPLADQRLVATELQRLKDKANVVQTTIMPKEKFCFRRYRAEMMKRKHQTHNVLQYDDHESKEDKTTGSQDDTTHNDDTTKALHEQFEGRFLTERNDLSLIVNSDGNVKINDNQEKEFYPEDEIHDMRREPKSFLLQNLTRCRILLKGTYESIHIIGAKDCNIRIINPIHGPVHVTNCHQTSIYIAFSRQLRIHDCTNVGFYIHVGSGPIIEGCRGMKFYQRDNCTGEHKGKNLYWDVKDFNWLKNNVKSPNFEVFIQDNNDEGHADHVAILDVEEDMQEAEESSDDEL